ncbi:expressed unknown protein [Seminavis robusta]|uniref:J domain-containing protein n=1 Tax=Seminavis robusta TaxID=568900 RepID=A0A9N8DLZ5_9STRA|nr:expressed unknown protein [Seminavis robusta]|eukprot:Sro206_g086450.1 n/a (625) ;mRNA; f:14331-16205
MDAGSVGSILSWVEGLLLKVLQLLVWLLERFLIEDRSQDSDYRYHQNWSSGGSSGGSSDNEDQGKRALQEAMKLFGIDSLDDNDVTKGSLRKIWMRLNLTYHPDKNNNSPDSIEKTQQINEAYERLWQELDKRDGVDGADDGNEASTPDHQQEDRPISKQERKRQKKERQKARQHAKRQQQEEWERRREAWEAELTRVQEEMERKAKEYKKKENHRKKERRMNEKKAKELGLENPGRRVETFHRWVGDAIALLKSPIDSSDCPSKYYVMELCNHPIAEALRTDETDIAIELVHETICDAIYYWAAKVVQEECFEIDSKMKDFVLSEALLLSLDEDGNSLIHYAVYFGNNDMLSYLAQKARKRDRLQGLLASSNVHGLAASDFALLRGNERMQRHMKKLQEEVEERIQSSKLLPTIKRYMATLGKAPSMAPAMVSLFGISLGMIAFETGWIMTFAILGFVMKEKQSVRQGILSDPGAFPRELLSFHLYWLLVKKIHQGIAAVSEFYYLSIPFVFILWLFTPPKYASLPFHISNFAHGWTARVVDTVPLPTNVLSPMPRALCWMLIHTCVLLAVKAQFAMALDTLDVSGFHHLEQQPTHREMMQLESKQQHAMDVFNAFLKEEGDL